MTARTSRKSSGIFSPRLTSGIPDLTAGSTSGNRVPRHAQNRLPTREAVFCYTVNVLFDTHAHLNDPKFDEDRGDVLLRAVEANVGRVVEIADEPADWEKAISLSRARPDLVRCTLGLHPYYADQWTPALGEKLKELAKLPEVVAAGEIGLDYAKCTIAHDVQKEAMMNMLEAADAAGLPVVLHCRDAYADMMPMLSKFYSGRKPTGRFHGVIHCFSGSTEDALQGIELGFALGVDGPVTYPKNDALRAALKAAGIESLVLETDSPYLPPQSSRGKRNEPRAVAEIAARLAQLFALKEEEAAALTTKNAHDLFRMS